MLSKRQQFLEAHRLTRMTIRAGDNYQVTFGACLRHVQAWCEGERGLPGVHVPSWKRVTTFLADAFALAVLSLLVAAILAVLPAATVADATHIEVNEVYTAFVVVIAAAIVLCSERGGLDNA